jgi:hypothetical protein
MDVSGIVIKTASILIIPKAEKNSGRISLRETLNAINVIKKNFLLWDGEQLSYGNARQWTPLDSKN